MRPAAENVTAGELFERGADGASPNVRRGAPPGSARYRYRTDAGLCALQPQEARP